MLVLEHIAEMGTKSDWGADSPTHRLNINICADVNFSPVTSTIWICRFYFWLNQSRSVSLLQTWMCLHCLPAFSCCSCRLNIHLAFLSWFSLTVFTFAAFSLGLVDVFQMSKTFLVSRCWLYWSLSNTDDHCPGTALSGLVIACVCFFPAVETGVSEHNTRLI